MINYMAAINRFGIEPKGVVHIGAWDGAEDATYRAGGFSNRLFVEANPEVYVGLVDNLSGSGAHCENFAISDYNGTATFHIADNGQSSSILPMKHHLDVYPQIKQTKSIIVNTIRLDDLLLRPAYCDMNFNFLNVDIQGAELLALSGAVHALNKMDLINLEVNFDELYHGAPHIRDLDGFLAAFDFIRADTALFHATWGDALWVKNKYTKAIASNK